MTDAQNLQTRQILHTNTPKQPSTSISIYYIYNTNIALNS